MLLNIYFATAIASFGINIAALTATIIRAKQRGYSISNSYSEKLSRMSIGKKIASIASTGIFVLAYIAIKSSIPILNVRNSIKMLSNWETSIYKDIENLDERGIITSYHSSSNIYSEEKSQNNDLERLLRKEKDQNTVEMIQSMYLDGANKEEIKQELKESKVERKEINDEIKNRKSDNFAIAMIDYIRLNANISEENSRELYSDFKNIVAKPNKETDKPVYKTLSLVYGKKVNQIK